MKNIMKNAWEIARKGQQQFGGKVSEYLSEAMKIAWAQAKVNEPVYIEVSEGSRKHRSYVAEIVGEDAQWGFARHFISKDHENLRIKFAYMENGNVYEVQDGGDRHYVHIVNGKVVEIEKSEVLEIVNGNNRIKKQVA